MRRRPPVLIGVWLLSGWIASCGDDSVPDHPTSRVAGTSVNQDHDGDRVIPRMQGSPPGQGIRSLDALATAREELAGSVRGMLADMDREAATVRALPLLGLAVIRTAGNSGDIIPRLTSHPQVQRAELSVFSCSPGQRRAHDPVCADPALATERRPQMEHPSRTLRLRRPRSKIGMGGSMRCHRVPHRVSARPLRGSDQTREIRPSVDPRSPGPRPSSRREKDVRGMHPRQSRGLEILPGERFLDDPSACARPAQRVLACGGIRCRIHDMINRERGTGGPASPPGRKG